MNIIATTFTYLWRKFLAGVVGFLFYGAIIVALMKLDLISLPEKSETFTPEMKMFWIGGLIFFIIGVVFSKLASYFFAMGITLTRSSSASNHFETTTIVSDGGEEVTHPFAKFIYYGGIILIVATIGLIVYAIVSNN